MKLGHIEIFVRDPAESRAFWEDVIGAEVETIQGEGAFVWLTLAGQTFLLRPGKGPARGEDYQHAPTGFVLYTSDLPATAGRLRERGLLFKGTDGSDECLTFTDPDGNWFQLVNPGDH